MKLLMTTALMLLATPARAQQAPVTPADTTAGDHLHERVELLGDAVKQMKAGDNDKALASFSTLIGYYERYYAAEKRRRYCVWSDEEARDYLGGLEPTADGVFVERIWCEALSGKAVASAAAKKMADARSLMHQVTEMAPRHAQYLNESGDLYHYSGEFLQSFELYQRAAAATALLQDREVHNEEIAAAWRGMGADLIGLERWDEAEAMYRKALVVDENDAEAKSQLDYIAQHRPKKS